MESQAKESRTFRTSEGGRQQTMMTAPLPLAPFVLPAGHQALEQIGPVKVGDVHGAWTIEALWESATHAAWKRYGMAAVNEDKTTRWAHAVNGDAADVTVAAVRLLDFLAGLARTVR